MTDGHFFVIIRIYKGKNPKGRSNQMKKFSEFITKHKIFVVILTALLLIPAFIGYSSTKINYDLLAYLPGDIETVEGQNILTDDFGIGAFATVVVKDKVSNKELLQIEDEIKNVDGVSAAFSVADLTGTAIPTDFLPSSIRESVTNGDMQLMMVTFENGSSDERTLDAIREIRTIMGSKYLVGGMSSTTLDTMIQTDAEVPFYVLVAVILCLIVLELCLDSYVVPIVLLANIGIAIIFNLGTNIFLGQISYITQAIASVLQLGVTMDFSIFLYHKYEAAKKNAKNKEEAMQVAMKATASSVVGSALTTFAGFLALCTMTLTIGADIGIVMAKGVVIGVICALTVFPALLLVFDKWIDNTRHKSILPEFKHIKNFVIKYNKAILIVFVLAFIPAYYLNSQVDVYYKLDGDVSQDSDSQQANKILKEDFGIYSEMMILTSKNLSTAEQNAIISSIEDVDGVSAVVSSSLLESYGLSQEILPASVADILSSENYDLMIVMSEYETATDELSNQINQINEVVKSYDENALVAGEGPLMKDLVETADTDFTNVNFVSIAVIFVIMLFVLKSISLPVLLILAIEFAIFANMGISTITGASLPFIASIVIGTIQLGATIDYAILLTTNYLYQRDKGLGKKVSAKKALDNSIQSIFVSAMCFFAATIGVGIISQEGMIASICVLIARGALISMLVVVMVVPSMLITFDKLIMKTTLGTKRTREKDKKRKLDGIDEAKVIEDTKKSTKKGNK